jgi:flagellar hook-associated protein 3 FlgL
MRISSSQFYTGGAAQIDNLQAQLVQTQEELSTGTSILTPADNPVAAAQSLVVTETQANNTQYMANQTSATNSLSQETATLQSATTLIQNAQTAIVDANNGSYTLQQRQAIATGLQATYNQLLGLANSQDGNGNYLFSGYQNGTPPFSPTLTGATYNGDQGQTSVQVGPQQYIALNDSGDSVFENNVTGNGTFTTQATTTNAGSGIISTGSVYNPAALTGDNYQLTFSGIQTTATPGNTGSGTISVGTPANSGLNPTGDTFTLNFTSPTNYSVDNTTTGQIVSSNNAFVAGQPITVGDAQFSINGSPAAGDSFTVVDNPITYTVTDTSVPPSASSTVPVPSPNYAYVPGQTIQFDGLQFNVTGTPDNGDTFTVNPSAKQSVFTTLTNLINLLNTPTGTGVTGETNLANGLNTASNNLSSALNNMLTVQASIGARLNELTSLGTEGQNQNVQYSTTLSNLQGLDYAKTISDFTQQQTTLSAAQQSFVKIANLSLFNYIN